MRCISLWQPWATLIATGAKRIETRGYSTNVRGLVGIHAAAKWTRPLWELCLSSPFFAELSKVCDVPAYYKSGNALPRGGIVAVVSIRDCYSVERLELIDANKTPELDASCAATLQFAGHSEEVIAEALKPRLTDQERAFGDFSSGRYGWMLENPRPLTVPLAWKGKQGWFNVPDDLILPRLAGECAA